MNILELSIKRSGTTGFMIICKTPLHFGAVVSADSLTDAMKKLPRVAEMGLSGILRELNGSVGEGKVWMQDQESPKADD